MMNNRSKSPMRGRVRYLLFVLATTIPIFLIARVSGGGVAIESSSRQHRKRLRATDSVDSSSIASLPTNIFKNRQLLHRRLPKRKCMLKIKRWQHLANLLQLLLISLVEYCKSFIFQTKVEAAIVAVVVVVVEAIMDQVMVLGI